MSTHLPTMTPPQIDLDRLNELEAKATPGPLDIYPWRDGIWHIAGSYDTLLFVHQTAKAFPAMSKELAELREEVQEAKKWNEHVDAQCREARAQLTASQASERRMRGLVKKSIDYLRDVFGQDPAELRAELEAAMLTTPVKAESAVKISHYIYSCPTCGRTARNKEFQPTSCLYCVTTPPAEQTGGAAS